MEKLITGALAALFVALALFFVIILGTFMGGIAGWVVGLVFSETIMTTLDAFGVETFEMTMWQLGATLGFVSGFFKVYHRQVSK